MDLTICVLEMDEVMSESARLDELERQIVELEVRLIQINKTVAVIQRLLEKRYEFLE